MTFLLDTSILIELLRENNLAWDIINFHKKEEILTSSICEAEMYAGIYREKEEKIPMKKKIFQEFISQFEVVPFSSEQADIAGRIKAELSLAGMNIDDFDVLIAAAAITNDAILLTKNVKHFSRIKNLLVQTI